MHKEPLIKTALLLLIVTLFFWGVFQSQTFLIPIMIAGLLSMVLLPLTRRMERNKIPRIVSITLCLLLVITLVGGFIFLFYSQVMGFSDDIPLFKIRASEKIEKIQSFIEDKTNLSSKEQLIYFKSATDKLLNSSGNYIKNILIALTGGAAIFSLIIIYIFFFLFYREKFKIFILKLSPPENHDKVTLVLNHIIDMAQHYLLGIFIELAILGTLNALGLLVIGLPQAIFLGYLAGLLNVIPYVGVMIGSLFPIFIAFIFKESVSAIFAVAAVMMVNQFIDNHFLTPKIVGSHVQINPLAAIMAIIIGGLLCGIPGMILAIPFLGIFKIICDNVEGLKPLGYLFGEEVKSSSSGTIGAKIKKMMRKPKNFPM